MLTRERRDADGNLLYRETYDSDGNMLTQEEDSDGDGTVDTRTTFTYDSNGNLLRFKWRSLGTFGEMSN